MRFEFAKFTDVTKYAKKLSKEKSFNEYDVYEKIFICPDTHDCWIVKIQVGYNKEFEKDDNAVIAERNMLEGMGARHMDIDSPNYGDKMIMLDIEDGCNWDVLQYNNIEEAIEDLDGGFGLIEEED